MSAADREKWNALWAAREGLSPASAFLLEQAQLPTQGRALDVAGGTGRHALWLAERGLQTTLLDVSPTALARASSEAHSRGLELSALEFDSDSIEAGESAFPAGPWDVILCHHFLWRPLFAYAGEHLSTDGVLLFCQPTQLNLERHPRPSARFLLEPGELEPLVRPHLHVLSLVEGWQPNGRHEAQLVARRLNQ